MPKSSSTFSNSKDNDKAIFWRAQAKRTLKLLAVLDKEPNKFSNARNLLLGDLVNSLSNLQHYTK